MHEDSNPNDDNNESTKFLKIFMDDTNEEKYDYRLITGDFNVAMKHNLDTLGYLHINNPNSRDFLTRQANLSNLVDIWRIRNPNSIRNRLEITLGPDWTTFWCVKTHRNILKTFRLDGCAACLTTDQSTSKCPFPIPGREKVSGG